MKQGLIHLDADVEKRLGTKVINQLRRDLFRLIEESEGALDATDANQSKGSEVVSSDAIPGPPSLNPSSPSSEHGSVKSGSAQRYSFGHGGSAAAGAGSGAHLSTAARNSFAAELLEIMDLAAAVL